MPARGRTRWARDDLGEFVDGVKVPGIIVGVDGSSHSRRALQWALSEAAGRAR